MTTRRNYQPFEREMEDYDPAAEDIYSEVGETKDC